MRATEKSEEVETVEEDEAVVAAVNARTDAALVFRGRAEFGKLGGAIFTDTADGRPTVVTTFVGSIADAERVAEVLNLLHGRGCPVPRHERVVELEDRVVFVQQRLPAGRPRSLSPARVEGIVEINDRFAGALTDLPDVVSVEQWFAKDGDPHRIFDLLGPRDHRAREVLQELIRLTTHPSAADVLAGADLVHVDLSAANVLFDENDHATGVVDWNLGAYRGDRLLALVQTRFDREWFVQLPEAEAGQIASARHLDDILTDRIDPDTLRTYWAYWLLHQLPRALRSEGATVIDWQLRMAESRLP